MRGAVLIQFETAPAKKDHGRLKLDRKERGWSNVSQHMFVAGFVAVERHCSAVSFPRPFPCLVRALGQEKECLSVTSQQQRLYVTGSERG